MNGSSANVGCHWVEIMAYDFNNVNKALNKSVTSDATPNSNHPISRITDGNTDTYQYAELSGTGSRSIQVDLGEVLDIKAVKMYHYYADSRQYNGNILQVSKDGINYKTVFNSDVDGRYTETSAGKQVEIINFGELEIKNQTDNEINFSATSDVTVNKVEILVNNILSKTYTDNFDNLIYTIDKSLFLIGDNNIITIRLTSNDTYIEEKVLTYTHTIDNLPTISNLEEVMDRYELLNSDIELKKNKLKEILIRKNLEITENENKLTDLIPRVSELGATPPPPLYLYKEGDECVDITGGWNLTETANTSTGTVQTEKRNNSIYMRVVANSSTGHGATGITANLINFTDYKTIYFDCDIGHSDQYDRNYMGIVNSSNTALAQYILKASTDLPRQIISLDVSNIRDGYIRLCPSTVLSGKWGEFILYNCWLEA